MDKKERQTFARIRKAVDDFGGLIREYRLEHNLSLQDLSEIMGYSASYIWRIENYKRFPELSTKIKMLIEIWPLEDVYSYLDTVVKREKNVN